MIRKQKNSVWSNIETVLDNCQKMSKNVNVNFAIFGVGLKFFELTPPPPLYYQNIPHFLPAIQIDHNEQFSRLAKLFSVSVMVLSGLLTELRKLLNSPDW